MARAIIIVESKMKKVKLKTPYLIFLGGETENTYAKTGVGIAEWCPDLCKGQMNLDGGTVDIGLPQMSIQDAVESGIKSMIIGTASIGGGIPAAWLETLEEAARAGLDIVAGVHSKLIDQPSLRAAAKDSGATLIDVRVPPVDLPVGTGKKRTGKRLLTVGVDCALGKKYSALTLERDMKSAGVNVDFRASGQTGIMIAGTGLPIDSVVADFISGAAEMLSPNNTDDHWDVIEGQGSIFHPGYAGVSMGLLTGSQPDAFVACTEAGRTHIEGWPHFELPTIEALIERTTAVGKPFNADIRCVGICVNTSSLSDTERTQYLESLSKRTGLPCVDPLKGGTGPIIAHMNSVYSVLGQK